MGYLHFEKFTKSGYFCDDPRICTVDNFIKKTQITRKYSLNILPIPL